jgi:hypothetical protein
MLGWPAGRPSSLAVQSRPARRGGPEASLWVDVAESKGGPVRAAAGIVGRSSLASVGKGEWLLTGLSRQFTEHLTVLQGDTTSRAWRRHLLTGGMGVDTTSGIIGRPSSGNR